MMKKLPTNSYESTSVNKITTQKTIRKKSKVKKDEIAPIEWPIPTHGIKPMNLFMPNRGQMQRMITRIMVAKEKGDLIAPEYEEIRPWIKQKNLNDF